MKIQTVARSAAVCLVLCLLFAAPAVGNDEPGEEQATFHERVKSLRAAVEDLMATFPERYPLGPSFLVRFKDVDEEGLDKLQREALLANPLIADNPLLFVVRYPDRAATHEYLGGNTFLGNGSALKLLDVKSGKTTTLVDNPDGVIRSPCVNFDGKRVVFSMNKGGNFHIFEIDTSVTVASRSGEHPIRQLTTATDVSDVDPVYLPDGGIAFASSRNLKWVPCDTQVAPQLFRMTGDGENIHQITRSLVHENQLSLMPDGRILYSRWDYVDRNFADGHGFWVANPDGTDQAIIWGNNTTHPSAGWNARAIPGTGQLLCILGTHHNCLGGALAVLDPTKAVDGYESVVRTWPAHVKERFRDLEKLDLEKEKKRHVAVWKAMNTWPPEALRLAHEDSNLRIHRWDDAQWNVKPWYDTPWPLVDGYHAAEESSRGDAAAGKYFLCSRGIRRRPGNAIWLVDVFGNEIKVHCEDPGCYSPMPLAPTRRPISLPPRRDYGTGDGYLYVRDVYQGTHMQGVERGAVKQLRVVEVPDKEGLSGQNWMCLGSQRPAVNWSDFNTKRILGTVPVAEDGSAYFAVPSDRFVYFQLLDENGMMIQSMRTGTSVHSGETLGCVGCHESRLASGPSLAASAPPRNMPAKFSKLKPWYGLTRRFSYLAEVQPVLDKHCLKCHDFGGNGAKKVILSGDRNLSFNFSYVELWRKGYVGAIGAGPAGHLPAYSWGSHGSKLIKHLRGGHQKLKLDGEDLDRLITWVDLNGPYYPTTCSTGGAGGRTTVDINKLLGFMKLSYTELFHGKSFVGPMVNLDRPELSPCLAKLEKDSPKYKELLETIRQGKEQVREKPRGDVMEGLVPHNSDRNTMAHREKYRRYELEVRKAIREGRELRDSDLVQDGAGVK